MARINIRKFIAEHYRGGIIVRDVIREAITNSIQAGAKNIGVDLVFSERNQEMFADLNERRVLETISISDDGEGFTVDNLQYFDEICTNHKDNIGGKGVGRLSFLKFADRVEVTSQLENEQIYFSYTPEFSLDNVVKKSLTGEKKPLLHFPNSKNKLILK